MEEPKRNGVVVDVWVIRLRLTFEFTLTVLVLLGAYSIAFTSGTSETADSGAAALATLVIGYWFGRGVGR